MWRILLLLVLFTCAKSFADDLFNGEVAFEFDPNFQDDFESDMRGGSFGENKENSKFDKRDIIRYENSLSLQAGNETIASRYYFSLFPQGHFNTSYVSGQIGVPLRFAVYDNADFTDRGRSRGFMPFDSFIKPRPEDFRSFWDSQRLIRNLEFFSPKDPYFFRLSRSHQALLGQGELFNMEPSGLYDQDALFLTGHLDVGSNSSTNIFLGPLLKAEILGVSSRFFPFASSNATSFIENLSFELTYVNDFFAPNRAVREGERFVLDDERRFIKRVSNTAQGLVFSSVGEYEAFSWLKLRPYASLGQLWLTGLNSYGGGVHLGHDLIIDFLPGANKSQLVFKTEGRFFSQQYWPGYFGPTYLIDRLVQDENQALTKSEWLSRSGDGHFRVGYLLGLSYAFDEWVSSSISYENAHSLADGNAIAPMRKVQLLTSFSAFDRLRLFLGYQATAIRQFDQLFDFDKSRGLLSLRGQVKLSSIVYFDAWAKHSFGVSDMFVQADKKYSNGDPIWLSNLAETQSLNFGLGLELSMTF